MTNKTKLALAFLLVLVLNGCVKTDPPVTGEVLKHHERVFEDYALYYLELDKDMVIEVSLEVFLIAEDGDACTFSGTSANNPHRYGRVRCAMPPFGRD